MKAKEKLQHVHMSLKEVEKRFPDGLPFLDPIEDMKIEDANFNALVRKMEAIDTKITKYGLFFFLDFIFVSFFL